MSTQVKNVNKYFGNFQALKDINLTIQEGEFVAILGPSGCGKTTLLRLMAGFDHPTEGEIQIQDAIVSSPKKVLPPDKRNVSMVFQGFALWPHMTVSEHIQFPLDHDRFASKELKGNASQRVQEVLEIINLTDKAESLPGALSGGQKQRVALGRAIATKPELLLMDEPLSALDAELRLEMRREIQSLHHLTNAAIVYVTHDQGEALAMADRIVVMNAGRIEQIGTPEEIYYHPQSSFVASFVGKSNLFQGEWQEDHFKLSGTDIVWPNDGTSEALMAENLYALRPEQIQLVKDAGDHLRGEILTKQFQGKEYHYSLQVADQVVIAQRPYQENFDVGETVGLVPVVA